MKKFLIPVLFIICFSSCQKSDKIQNSINKSNHESTNVMFIRRVTGNVFGQGGGGWEIIYKGPLNLDQYTITITKLP